MSGLHKLKTMLPLNAGKLELTPSSREKLDGYFRRFCEGENGRRYGVTPVLFACHASFPLLLSPGLANLIWLNFKNFTVQKDGHAEAELQNIDSVTVSDFLLSPLVRPVAARQYEVIPDIRAYLLYLLKDGRWFNLYGITSVGSTRLQELAQFLLQYVDDKMAQTENNASGFLEVNRWAALAYLQPDALALHMSKALKENLDSSNELGQLRLNLLMDRFDAQYELDIQKEGVPAKAFINLHTYSKANKAILFEQEMNVISDKFNGIEDEFIGQKNSSTALVELPVLPTVGQRLKRKKNKVQRMLSLLIGIDKYADPALNILKGCVTGAKQIEGILQGLNKEQFDTQHLILLPDAEATYQNILSAIQQSLSNANTEDIFLIYFSGHAEYTFRQNRIFPFDYSEKNSINAISNAAFYDIITAANTKKCQTVFILDSHTGYYKWIDDTGIFLGGVHKTMQMERPYKEFPASAFLKSLIEIIHHTDNKITNRDIYLWLKFKMANDFENVNETPVMLTARENLDNYFLTKTPAGQHNYSLIAFNNQTSSWQLVAEDFRVPLLSRQAWVYDYSAIAPGETGRGELFQREGIVLFGGETDSLSKEDIYKINVAKNPLITLVYWYGKQHLAIATTLGEELSKLKFDHFFQWQMLQPSIEGIDSESQIERGTKHERELVITIEGNSDAYFFRTTYHVSGPSSAEYLMLSWITPTEALLIESIKKFNGYMYFKSITLPEYLNSSRLQLDILYQWQTNPERTAYQSASIPLHLDNRSFTIHSGKISFYPLNLILQSREEDTLYYDLYIVVSDFTIQRISAGGDNKIENNSAVTVTMNDPKLFDKILSNNLGAEIKILLSRDPIRYEFLQTGIN